MLPAPAAGARPLDFLYRMRHASQMDWDYALWQMLHLPLDARRVFRTSGYHHDTKGQWARDDPAFLVLLMCFIAVASLAFALAFFADTPATVVRILVWTVVVDLLATGAAAATLGWLVANRWMRASPTAPAVEWAYCFDIHCNAWFCLFLYVYLGVYALLPLLIVPSSWPATLLANSLYAAGITHYCYVTFLGYSSMPTLRGTNMLLWPVVAALVLLVLLTLAAKFNVVIFVMNIRYASG